MPTNNKKLTLSFTNQDDRLELEKLREVLEANLKKRMSLAEVVRYAIKHTKYNEDRLVK